MRVLFVCRMFDRVAGGVERMAVVVMNALSQRGHDVSLFTWDAKSAQAFYPMRDAVRWHRLNMGDPMRPASPALRLARLRRFRELASSSRPDAVVAFQHGPFLFAAAGAMGNGIPVILSERNAPDRLDHTRAGRHRGAMFQSMRLAAAIAVQFPGYIDRYPPYLRHRIVVVPNPVERAEAFASPGAEKPQRTLLFVGRLSYQKNVGALLRAFARLADTFPTWRLRLVGEGEERAHLDALAGDLGIGGRVTLAGTTADVATEYCDADLFCLPSRWEGFPNALAEAMAHGLPAVGYQECAGVNELIVPGRNGALAGGNGDPGTLADALATLMSDDDARSRLGGEARRLADAYEPGRIIDAWESLLHRVAHA